MILSVIQARSGSTRLPRKVLAPLAGRALILRLVDRVASAQLVDRLVVATTTDASDDELAGVLRDEGVEVRRGPVDDVLSRFLTVIEEFDPDHVVRLTGDNPLVDHATVDLNVQRHLEVGADYTTNGLSERFPHGLNVEVLRADALRRLDAMAPSDEEREHVTLGILRRPDDFTLAAVTQLQERASFRWTVDIPEDLVWVQEVFGELSPTNQNFGQEDVVNLIERRPELLRTLGDYR